MKIECIICIFMILLSEGVRTRFRDNFNPSEGNHLSRKLDITKRLEVLRSPRKGGGGNSLSQGMRTHCLRRLEHSHDKLPDHKYQIKHLRADEKIIPNLFKNGHIKHKGKSSIVGISESLHNLQHFRPKVHHTTKVRNKRKKIKINHLEFSRNHTSAVTGNNDKPIHIEIDSPRNHVVISIVSVLSILSICGLILLYRRCRAKKRNSDTFYRPPYYGRKINSYSDSDRCTCLSDSTSYTGSQPRQNCSTSFPTSSRSMDKTRQYVRMKPSNSPKNVRRKPSRISTRFTPVDVHEAKDVRSSIACLMRKNCAKCNCCKCNGCEENVCLRPWAFERVPNKMIRGLDAALIYTSTKEACLAACLNEHRFTCRSVEYNYVTLQCHLSDSDRRTTGQFVQFVDAQGVDYFENLCLKGKEACKAQRHFQVPRIGVADDKVAQYAGLHYYADKELQVQNDAACRIACEIENEFLCRSYLFRGPPIGPAYNCHLFHLDHWTLPDGPSTYLNAERPLIDNGERVGTYFENFCEKGKITDPQPDLNVTVSPNDSRFDINCDKTGTCYDVIVDCKDTRIAVQVQTNKPFNGRIYALGRSETCNIDVTNSKFFRLDLTMSGQDCNTQSVTGTYSNTVVLQHHSVVMTKADKIYKVKCTYDMSSKNITFGMMPIRDPDTISITSAPEAPPPKIRILDSRAQEVETVRIGDKLTFRIEIPEDTPYGIFARSCVAMAKDAKSTFQIIDDEGCPVDSSIFPSFTPDGNALQSSYEAFRFTESYGVIFQCNVKYCLGPCEPAVCEYGRDSSESWGRRRRRSLENTTEEKGEDMTLSQEILVLDFGDEKQSQFLKTDASIDFNEADKTVTIIEPCPTKTSVLALGVTCALLILIYISTLFCYYMKKWLTPRKMMP